MTNPKLAEMVEKVMSWDAPEGVPYTLPETIEHKRRWIADEIQQAYELGRADENEAIAKSQECGKPEEHKARNCSGCMTAMEIRSRLSGTGGRKE